MKKALLAFVLLASMPAFAQWHHHHHYGYRNNWVAPLLGGVIGYEIARHNQPVIVQQQPVIVQNPPVVYQPKENCTAWVETQHPDGTVTRTRTCTQ
jgi:hypothetical protein